MSSPRDTASLRQTLDPLTTSSTTTHNVHEDSPTSAAAMSSPHTQSVTTPASAIQPYNPQEWGPSLGRLSERSRQLSMDGGQALPPPPYSPPRSRQQRSMSTAFEPNAAPSSTTPPPATRLIMTQVQRPSPEPIGNNSFPPPPGAGTRANSRERRFGLPSLMSRRRDHGPSPSISPDLMASVVPLRGSVFPTSSRRELDRGPPPSPRTEPLAGPPAARRAVSTGALEMPTSQRSRSASQSRWEPGMPLPPPPPGPPPSSSRSQSVHSIDRSSVPILSPPTRRPPPSGVTSLGPVPPTPAGWADRDASPSRLGQTGRGKSPGLVIDTATAASARDVPEPLESSNSHGGLNRARAVRHDKTILQRRAESRTRQSPRNSIDASGAQPHSITDIVVPSGSMASARRPVESSSSRSAGAKDVELPRTGDSLTQDSRNSTPRAPASAQQEAATQPFSPLLSKKAHVPVAATNQGAKASPFSLLQAQSPFGPRGVDASRTLTKASAHVLKHTTIGQTSEQFAAATVERVRAFASEEASAASDADRVRLFADFIVKESRLRRERYSSAIGAMGSEIFDLTRDLFRPLSSPSRRESGASLVEWTPSSTDAENSRRDSFGSFLRGESLPSSAPTSAKPPTTPSAGPPPGNSSWATNYMPCLSPILSMSVSDNHENASSRGRPSSRWWESDSQEEPRVFERSRRESKYMGVPKDKWGGEEHDAGAQAGMGGSASATTYPPEKTGWHHQASAENGTPRQLDPSSGGTPGSSFSARSTYDKPGALDVSRLVTMPPPYPRHHPAVNNSHPKLMATRTSVRSLNEMAEVEGAKELFATASSKRRQDSSKAASQRRQALMASLQSEIDAGHMAYADAAAIESESQDQERDKNKDLEKEEYEKFQTEVVLPLNVRLTERIAKAGELLDDLVDHLFDNGELDADMPQEEGDDRPELLEKLTLLKWIFETRESLHRANFDILSDRNARYQELITAPYRVAGNQEKLKSAEAFFAEDAAKRESAFANEVLERARVFRSVVEDAVQRGIALQLSAFWDIAPPLRRLLDSIPSNLEGFNIQIPAFEFEENPAYLDHPLQYLYSLLMHAEMSTYQFIEAHTNLLCLLHEVKEAEANAKARVLGSAQTSEADSTAICAEERKARAQAMRQEEDRQLTNDLKEKVREVQDQWRSALGEGIRNVKERTAEWLIVTGGWDEALEETATFSAL